MADRAANGEAEILSLLDLMFDMSRRLPSDWRRGEFALSVARSLARFIDRHREVIDTVELADLLGAGGILVAISMAQAESPR